MNYNKMSVRDADLNGKKVLLRCDFNVPQDKETGAITSDKRIVAALPTIQYLLDNGAAVIACSHLGKPKGTWKESLTLAPVAVRLAELLGKDVIFAKDIIGEDAKAKAAALQPGQILLLENLRFDPRLPRCSPVRSCCLRTFVLIPVRRRTILSLPRSSPPWRSCLCPTRSAPCTERMPLLQALRLICPLIPAC